MSWKAGSNIFSAIIDILNNCDVDNETRQSIYEELIPVFEDEDCDTLYECVGEDKVFDSVWKQYAKDMEEETDEDGEEE